jgi:hypothetical protein
VKGEILTVRDNRHFDRLSEGLSEEQRLEWFKTLHETGITADDADLARLLRVLQLYKAFYEEIPARVREALKHADTLTTRINCLRDDLAECLDKALAELKQNTEVASTICAHFHDTQSHLTAAVEKSAAEVSRSLEAELRKSLSAVLLKPFESCLADIRDQRTLTANHAKQITTELRLARRIHIGAYGLAAVLISILMGVTSCFVAARQYSQREAELLQGIGRNRQVLSELARKGAVLEMRRNPADSPKLYLLVKRGKSWTTEKHVVIEMK